VISITTLDETSRRTAGGACCQPCSCWPTHPSVAPAMHLAPAWRLSSRRRQHVFVVLTQGPAGRARLGGVDLVRDRHLVGRLTSMLAIARSSSPLDANPRSSRVVALSFPVGPTPAAMLRPPCINRSATRLV